MKRGQDKKRKQRRPRSGGAGGGSVWLFGHHAVEAALANPDRACHRLVITAEAETALAPVMAAMAALPPLERASRRDIDALLPPGTVHQGVALAVTPLPDIHVETLCRDWRDAETVTIVVLDQATDPHNIGAVLRSAAAFGAAAVIVPDRGSPEATGTLAKSASGALERVPLVRVTNLIRALGILKDSGFWCAGFDGRANQTLAAAALKGKIALVLGAEGKGLRRLTLETCDLVVKIPISEQIESLNLSNAAAIALYEVAKD